MVQAKKDLCQIAGLKKTEQNTLIQIENLMNYILNLIFFVNDNIFLLLMIISDLLK